MAESKLPLAFMNVLTEKKPLAYLATVMPDGTPQVTPVWFDLAGGNVRINTARGRIKDRNMMHNAAVALAITDPDNAYRHIAIRGRIVSVTEEGGDAHIDSLAKKYLGVDSYPFRRAGEVRVIYEIEPASVAAMG